MQNIVSIFRPWLDAHPEVDIYHSDRDGWVCVSRFDGVELPRVGVDRQTMLTVIAAWFFDDTDALTWKGAAEEALQNMRPYLDQLPPEDTDTVNTIMGLFLKFNEERSLDATPALS